MLWELITIYLNFKCEWAHASTGGSACKNWQGNNKDQMHSYYCYWCRWIHQKLCYNIISVIYCIDNKNFSILIGHLQEPQSQYLKNQLCGKQKLDVIHSPMNWWLSFSQRNSWIRPRRYSRCSHPHIYLYAYVVQQEHLWFQFHFSIFAARDFCFGVEQFLVIITNFFWNIGDCYKNLIVQHLAPPKIIKLINVFT